MNECEGGVSDSVACRCGREAPGQSVLLGGLLHSPVVQEVVDSFCHLFKVAVTITDLHDNVLSATGWKRICTGFHRLHPVAGGCCLLNERYEVKRDGSVEWGTATCGNGLTNGAVPVAIDGRYLGKLVVGQFFTEPPDERRHARRAWERGLDVADYLVAVREVPVVSEERIPALLEFAARLTRLIGDLAKDRLRARESEAMRTAILNTIPQGVFWKRSDGVFLGCNTAFSAAAGLSTPEEIVGKTDFDLPWPREHAEAYRADDHEVISKKGPKLHKVERLRRADGREIIADISRVPLVNGGLCYGVLGVVQDITVREYSEQALHESESKFRALSEHSLVGIFIVQDGRFTYVNSAFCDIFGYTPAELIGCDPMRVVHPEDRARVSGNMESRLGGRPVPARYEVRGLCKNGEVKQGEMYVACTVFGNRAAIIGNVLDITDRKVAQQSLQAAYDGLSRTLDDTVVTMAKIVEMRDPYTAGHQQRVASLAVAIARELDLEQERVNELRMAASIHDIGKMNIPAEILAKPGRLTGLELQLMMTHAQSGYDIVKNMNFMPRVALTILQHHERLDGSGYPNGLRGDEILLEARVLAVADVVEAMASHRPYRPARGIGAALREISENRGKAYDDAACAACARLFAEKGFRLDMDETVRSVAGAPETRLLIN